MPIFNVNEGGVGEQEIEAATAVEAGEIYLDGYDACTPLGRRETLIVDLGVCLADDPDSWESVTVTRDAAAPDCSGERDDHDFVQTDLRGSGGGVRVSAVCRHCGCASEYDGWDQSHGGEPHEVQQFFIPSDDEYPAEAGEKFEELQAELEDEDEELAQAYA